MPEQVNAAFRVEAHCIALVDDESRTTRFVLRLAPDVVHWLFGVIDYIQFELGRSTEARTLPPPPGGETLQRLVAGGAIFSSVRPDGGVALRLNPSLQIQLWLSVRVRGEPARVAIVNLAAQPELARWLLAACLQPSPPAVPPAGPLADELRRHGLLVTALPPPDICLPDPANPPDTAATLATAERVIPQAAGKPVPGEVCDLLGRHLPRLPTGLDLWWVVEAGTGLVLPVPAPATPPPLLPGHGAAARRAAWNAQRAIARQSLVTQRYAVLREILATASQALLRHHVRELVARGYFPPLGDEQVERRMCIHNEPTIASLHRALANIVSSICGEDVQASYCYLSCYESGAVLPPHKDRPQCQYNLSLVFDMQGPAGEPDPWPIYLELDGRPQAVLLRVGDGLVYSGTDLLHWREALPPGQRAIVCFFHFVPKDFTGSLD